VVLVRRARGVRASARRLYAAPAYTTLAVTALIVVTSALGSLFG
jgi:hypothetical protein